MSYSVQDIVGLLLATASFAVVLLLPGIALAHLCNVFAFRRRRTAEIYGLGLLVGYAVLPVADSLLARFLGLDAALAFNLLLAALGLSVIWSKGLPLPSRLPLLAGGIWLAALLIAWIDLDTGRALHPSLLMIDMVKHAATVRSLMEAHGAPPLDPFFLRDAPAAYYYFFYMLSALAERLCAGLIDSRAAVGGQVFWTGTATAVLVFLIYRRCGLRNAKPNGPLVLALMLAAGLQIVPILGIGLGIDQWMGQINWWNDAFASWPMSLLWVPHHVACLVVSWTSFLLLAGVVERGAPRRHDAGALAVAAAGFATAAGLSIWVTVGAVATMLLWLAALLAARRWAAVLTVAATGIASLLIALPYLADLVSYRAYGSLPIAPTIRSFPYTDMFFDDGVLRYAARLLALPLNLAIELGVFLVGACLFWWRRASLVARPTETARLLALSALATLLIGVFLKSTIVYNDLGFRVVLFAQLAALVWTAAALAPDRSAAPASLRVWLARAPAAVVATLVLGYCGLAYDFVALRVYNIFGLTGEGLEAHAPATDRDLRAAYAWLAANTDHRLVVQHNPDVNRAFAYGLYGRTRVAVSDRHNGPLFGASISEVARRLNQVIPVFASGMPGSEARRRLAASRVDAALVTSSDAAWADKASWVWSLPPLYANRHVRVLSVRDGDNATARLDDARVSPN